MAQTIDQLKKYPKVWEKLLQWEVENLKTTQQLLIKEFKDEEIEVPEVSKELVEPILAGAFEHAPHFLYDFLDPVGIFVFIQKSSMGFYAIIDGKTLNSFYDTRKEAEKAGFEEALSVLENKLT